MYNVLCVDTNPMWAGMSKFETGVLATFPTREEAEDDAQQRTSDREHSDLVFIVQHEDEALPEDYSNVP